MDRRVGAAVAGLVVVALGLVAWETFDDRGRNPRRARQDTALADGFRVAPGSRLVGTVFPRPAGAVRNDPGGWNALLDVDGDAVTVFDAYLEQARRLGYREIPATAGSPCSVRNPHPGRIGTTTSVPGPVSEPVEQVLCSGSYDGDDGRSVSIELQVCSTCDVPVSAARITTHAGTTPVSAPVAAIVDAPRSPSLRLSSGQHRRAWSARGAKAGAGTRALSPDVSFGDCDGDAHTVLEVTGDPREVFDAYVRAQPPEETGTTVRTDVGADHVTAWHSVRGIGITLVESTRLRRPLLALDTCYLSPG